ncbi:bifunctional 2',3'-cyclic-nucleotide 2'-phosphodiesterase/3'-nucleotidase [Phaeovulum sp.]|uniref:bifunctional 2',3'-cyclic-nucleotide 2'-phosphodiesterase/3'-nucleotidase n=1 Tax=Phaeovulum sp. TaxID=2934796 RepID=UPI0039E3B64D
MATTNIEGTQPGTAATRTAQLRILETTDLHAHVFAYDYYADRPDDRVGLARTAALIEAARAEVANALLFDNGDFLHGTPLGDYVAQRGLAPGQLHPMTAAMNALGYDAATLGNHEFNHGLEFLLQAIAPANFPIISANIALRLAATPEHDQTLLPPYIILDRILTDETGAACPIRVGVIGLLPPQIVAWDRKHLAGRVETRGIVEAARAHVPRLRAAGADIVIALAHTGIGADGAAADSEHAAVPLAAVPGIDAILAGHSHLTFPSPDFPHNLPGVDAGAGRIGRIPVVMAGLWGSDLGIIDLALHHDAAGWRVTGATASTRRIFAPNPNIPPCPPTPCMQTPRVSAVLAAAEADHLATLAHIRRPVGRSTAPMHSYFSMVAPDAGLNFVAEAQRWHVAKMLSATPEGSLPILSAVAPFKCGGRSGPHYFTEIPAGDLVARNLADLYLFPNTIRALKITGAQLADWLERAAGIFARLSPGQPDQPLLDPNFPSYNFDVVTGLTYDIDLSQPARFDPLGRLINPTARRVRNLRMAGQKVPPDAALIVATNSFRASGVGSFAGAEAGNIVLDSPDTIRDILLRYAIEAGDVHPRRTQIWRFAPAGQTTAVFDTGPGAAAYLDELANLDVSPLGLTANGFARYRIRL